MSLQATSVLDASALLAYLQGEPGAANVATDLTKGSAISSINWAETLSKLAKDKHELPTLLYELCASVVNKNF